MGDRKQRTKRAANEGVGKTRDSLGHAGASRGGGTKAAAQVAKGKAAAGKAPGTAKRAAR
jgi:hypothetical protein